MAFDALRAKEEELVVKYQDTIAKHNLDVEIVTVKMEEWKKQLKDSLKNNAMIGEMPELPEQPPRPRLLMNDSTIEQIAKLLSHNNKGLTLFRDELAALLANLERRGGSDKEFFLESYGGRPHTVDRAKHPEPIIVPTNALSIIGGIQPDKLEKLILQSCDDGFSARFLYSYPDKRAFKRPHNHYDDGIVRQVADKLNKVQSDVEDGKFSKRILRFSDDAAKLLEQWCNEQNGHTDIGGLLSSFKGKMGGAIVRLSTVLTYMEWAISDDVIEPTQIDYETVLKAVGLVDGYYLPMAERTLNNCALSPNQRDARTIALWLLQHQRSVINLSELSRIKGSPLRDRNRLKSAFDLLDECHWLRFVGGRDDDRKGGRKRQDYAVNPLIYTECVR